MHSGRLVCVLCKLLSQESTQRRPEKMNLKDSRNHHRLFEKNPDQGQDCLTKGCGEERAAGSSSMAALHQDQSNV